MLRSGTGATPAGKGAPCLSRIALRSGTSRTLRYTGAMLSPDSALLFLTFNFPPGFPLPRGRAQAGSTPEPTPNGLPFPPLSAATADPSPFPILTLQSLHYSRSCSYWTTLSLSEPIIDTSTPVGEFALQIFGVIAEFERQRIRQRIQAGVRHARKSGKTLGRPRALTKEKADATVKLREQGTSISQLSRTFGVSPPTIRKYLAEQPCGKPWKCENPSHTDTSPSQ